MEKAFPNVESRMLGIPETDVFIMKLHPYNEDIASKASCVISAKRHPAGMCSSLMRKQGCSFEDAIDMVDDSLRQVGRWKDSSFYREEFRYEDIMADKVKTAGKVIASLELSVDPIVVSKEVDALSLPASGWDRKTNLHHNHITSKSPDDFSPLSVDQLDYVDLKYKEWMEENGYRGEEK
jgi:hypothetical protein